MSLEEIFPEDPTVPSLRYAASILEPLVIPWTRRFVPLGAGFHTDAAQEGDPFATECAFDSKRLETATLRYNEGSSGTFVQHDSVTMAEGRDHMDFSIAARAGGKIASASGRGRYELNALKQSNGITSSLTTRLGSGNICFESMPPFSENAIHILSADQAQEDVHRRFRRQYGDYYVSAVRLGAANATDLSASSNAEATSKDLSVTVTVTVKIWRWKAEKTWNKEEHSSSSAVSANIRFIGFDSLSDGSFDSQSNDAGSHDSLLASANKNLEKGRTLQGRLQQTKNDAISAKRVAALRMADLKAVFDAGLAVEIVLMPFAKLREYVARSSGDLE